MKFFVGNDYNDSDCAIILLEYSYILIQRRGAMLCVVCLFPPALNIPIFTLSFKLRIMIIWSLLVKQQKNFRELRSYLMITVYRCPIQRLLQCYSKSTVFLHFLHSVRQFQQKIFVLDFGTVHESHPNTIRVNFAFDINLRQVTRIILQFFCWFCIIFAFQIKVIGFDLLKLLYFLYKSPQVNDDFELHCSSENYSK